MRVRDLLRRAIYTVHKLCGDMQPADALATCLVQLVHDAKRCFRAVVSEGLRYMIGDFFDENLIQPCVELVKPVADAIPEFIKTLVSVEGLLEEALNDVVTACIDDCTAGPAAGSAGAIDSWRG